MPLDVIAPQFIHEQKSNYELAPIDGELSSIGKNLSNIKSDNRLNEDFGPTLKNQLNKSVEYRPRENKTIDVVEAAARENSESRKASL
jgi:hypothetical protein